MNSVPNVMTLNRLCLGLCRTALRRVISQPLRRDLYLSTLAQLLVRDNCFHYCASFCSDKLLAVITIVLLATTGRHNMHSASYVFGSKGIVNQTNGWDDGLAFLFGLLSVHWTVRSSPNSCKLMCPNPSFIDHGMFSKCLISRP